MITHRGILLLALLGPALVALALPQEGRPQSGWYSSRSRLRRPYTQPSPDAEPEEPSWGTRDDYGSRDPGYGRRARPGSNSRRPDSGYRPPQPDRSRQPGYGWQDPRQPYTPRQPPRDPRPPVYEPRQPVYVPRPPRPDPRPPRPDPRPPRPEYPRQPRPEYPRPPRPDPQPEYPQPEYPQPVYPQPEYPQPEYPQPDFPQPGQPIDFDNIVSRPADEKLILPIVGKYTGPDVLPHYGAPYPYLKGKEKVVGRGEVIRSNCAPTCRGQCTYRDDDCNCVQNRTCFEALKHRLSDYPNPEYGGPDELNIGEIRQPEACPNVVDCGECGYIVQWPDGWCLCETDPNCTPRAAAAYTKREVDLQKLILQRDAHMAELKRASRHSQDN